MGTYWITFLDGSGCVVTDAESADAAVETLSRLGLRDGKVAVYLVPEGSVSPDAVAVRAMPRDVLIGPAELKRRGFAMRSGTGREMDAALSGNLSDRDHAAFDPDEAMAIQACKLVAEGPGDDGHDDIIGKCWGCGAAVRWCSHSPTWSTKMCRACIVEFTAMSGVEPVPMGPEGQVETGAEAFHDLIGRVLVDDMTEGKPRH